MPGPESIHGAIAAPIVIVGSRRSGTTLLRTMLSNHPDLIVHPDEPQFILGLYQRFGRQIEDVPAAVQFLYNHEYVPKSVSQDSLRAAFESDETLSLASLIRRYFRLWGDTQLAGRRLVLKHPRLIFHLKLVFDLFPEAFIVHMVRDPRANVASQRARWVHLSIWEAAMWWRDAIRVGRRFAQRRSDHYCELRYADLVTAPELTLRTLCSRVDIEYTADLCDVSFRTCAYSRSAATEIVRYESLDTSRLSRWREELTPLDVRLIELGCRSEMTLYGYELDKPAVPIWQLYGYAAGEWLLYGLKSVVRAIRSRIMIAFAGP